MIFTMAVDSAPVTDAQALNEVLPHVMKAIDQRGLSLLVLGDRIRRLDAEVQPALVAADRGIDQANGLINALIVILGGLSLGLPAFTPGLVVELLKATVNVLLTIGVIVALLCWQLLGQIVSALTHGAYRNFVSALRTMPPMIAVLLFLFVTADAWKMFGPLPPQRVIVLSGLLFLCGTMFAWVRLSKARQDLYKATHSPDQLKQLVNATPASELSRLGIEPDLIPISGLLKINLWFTMFLSLSTSIVAAALWVSSAFLIFGSVAIDRSQAADMLHGQPTLIKQGTIVGIPLTLTSELVHVSILFGAIAALYLAGPGLTDDGSLSAFVDNIPCKLQEGIAAAAYYRGARRFLKADAATAVASR